MLLIDRILAAAHHKARRDGLDPGERTLLARLRNAVVYEVSSVVPLVGDWERERSRPIPKRSPHPMTWCEWLDADDGPFPVGSPFAGHRMAVRRGVFILEVPAAQLLSMGEPWRVLAATVAVPYLDPADKAGAPTWGDVLRPEDCCYFVRSFRLVESTDFSELKPLVMRPGQDWHNNFFAFHPDGVLAGCSLANPLDGDSPSGPRPVFGLVGFRADSEWYDPWSPDVTAWPPFMAFALLHCKNVVTTTHGYTEAEKKRVSKSGNPPRVSFKTIELKVPETVGPKGQSSPDPDAKGLTRFHLCRGHFKNLTHPKFKSPGLHWWPAHWRGNPEQGVVISDRAVVPADPITPP